MKVLPVLALLAAFTAGCVKAPPVKAPGVDLDIPETWSKPSPPEPPIDSAWWSSFESAELSAVVERVLAQNFDLRAATARLDQALAAAKIAGADLWPSAGVGFDGSRRKQNFIGFPIPGQEERVLSTTATNLGVSLDVSWEVDLWGRLSARAKAGLADFQATSAELQGARLSLAAQAVKAWFAIAEARQQLALAEATVESWRASSEQVRDRFEEGIRPSLDLRLALANLAGAEALLEQRKLQLDSAVRQLEVLMGDYPDKSILTPSALADTPPPIPSGIPAEIISRRPDLVAAERRVAAAGSRVAASKRDLYPRLSLTAAGGTASRALGDLLDGDFSVWSLVGNIVQPLFQGGRLRAEVARSKGVAEEVVATYASTTLRAFAEVETALAAESLLARREEALAQAAEQSREAQLLAEDRYGSGLESFITVLESQRRSLQAEGELIAARRLRLENRVDLHLALGGGFEPLNPYYERTNEPPSEMTTNTLELNR
jgi:NodT family efflux transporter outer membrane factor (OMF) lipoprotein